jgi:hypothetical protein
MKTIFTVVIAAAAFSLLVASSVEAAGGWRCRGRVTYAPAPSTVVVPGPVPTTAQAQGGYRTYSYQPAPAAVAPAARPMRSSGPARGFNDAGFKVRGAF